MSLIIESLEQFEELVQDANSSNHFIVDFHAPWCGPCRTFSPEFELLSMEYRNVQFLKVDIDQVPELAVKYDVEKLPTFLFFERNNLEPKFDTILGANRMKIRDTLDLLSINLNSDDF